MNKEFYPNGEKKEFRSIDIGATNYSGNLGRAATLTIQKAYPSKMWSDDIEESGAVCVFRPIKTKLRMLRALSLQSAFLAKGGNVLGDKQ
jgi:hypothetical protein